VKRCYEGRVLHVQGELVTMDLTCLTDDLPTVHADFYQSDIEGGPAEPGDLVDVVKVRGRMHVRLMNLGAWSEEALNKIWERARKRAEDTAKWAE